MAQENYEKLGVADLKHITKDLEDMRKWDVVHNSLVNVEIGVMSIEPIETQYGKALLATCLVNGKETLVLMGGQVLCQQLSKLEFRMPFLTTIIKTAKYYELS